MENMNTLGVLGRCNDVNRECNVGRSHDYLRTLIIIRKVANFQEYRRKLLTFQPQLDCLDDCAACKVAPLCKIHKTVIVFFWSCFVLYRLHSQKLPSSVLGIQSRTLENQSLFHVS